MNTGNLDNISWAECIVSSYFHTESLGDASHISTYITKSKNTQFFTLQLAASLAVVEITYCKDQQTEYQFSYCVRVLTRSILSHYIMGSSSSKVDVIITCTSTNDNLQVLCCIEHLSISLVRADNHRVHILHCIEKLSFLCILFEQDKFVARSFYFFFDSIYSSCRKWFFCCN